ncbi:hypothetical protein KSS87_000213, partial [Heliosperma pusillum]
ELPCSIEQLDNKYLTIFTINRVITKKRLSHTDPLKSPPFSPKHL